jgi:hypothetical protein
MSQHSQRLSSLIADIPERTSWTSEHWDRHYKAISSIFGANFTGSEIVENEQVLKYCRQLVDSLRRDPGSIHLIISLQPFVTLGAILKDAWPMV